MDGKNYEKTTGSFWSKSKWREVCGGEPGERKKEIGELRRWGKKVQCWRNAMFITTEARGRRVTVEEERLLREEKVLKYLQAKRMSIFMSR